MFEALLALQLSLSSPFPPRPYPLQVVVRFSEAIDGFALPPGHTHENVDLPVVKK